jgi:CheY-like chemotaxis protein
MAKSVKAKNGLRGRILLIEDDDAFAQAMAFALERHPNCDVKIAADAFEAGNLMALHAFDLVITDWLLPSFNGFSTLRKAEQNLSLDPTAPVEWFSAKKVPVVVITACDSDEIDREKRPKGHFRFLGVVSKNQPMERIIEQIELLFVNGSLAATA